MVGISRNTLSRNKIYICVNNLILVGLLIVRIQLKANLNLGEKPSVNCGKMQNLERGELPHKLMVLDTMMPPTRTCNSKL